MKVAMLLSKPLRFDPRVHHEARALLDAGHEVVVIEWARRNPDDPPTETIEGVPVVRVHNTGLLAAPGPDHIRNPIWWRRATTAACTLWSTGPDVVHCHDLDTLPAGRRVQKATGAKLVFDAHEIFADMLTGNQPNIVVGAAKRLERRLLPHVDLIIAPTPHVVRHYATRTKAPVVQVANTFSPKPGRYTAPTEGTFTITYIGTLSRDRLFPDLVDALGRTKGIRFVIAGKREGVYDDVEARAARYDNVAFLGSIPHDQVLPRTRAGHAVLCMLDPANPQYRVTPATKLFDAMATGRPIITTEGIQMGHIVHDLGMGRTCPYDPEAVADTVAALRDDPDTCKEMGRRGLKAARTEHNWPRQAEGLIAAYAALDA